MQLKANLSDLQARVSSSFQEGGLPRRLIDKTGIYLGIAGEEVIPYFRLTLIFGPLFGVLALTAQHSIQTRREAQAYGEIKQLADSNRNNRFELSEQLDVLRRAGHENIQLIGPHGPLNLPSLSLEDFERVKASYLNEQQVAEK